MQLQKKDTIRKEIVDSIRRGKIVGYSEGFFVVTKDNHYYLINAKSKKEYGPYLYTRGFHEGYAIGETSSIQGEHFFEIIDKKGNKLASFSTEEYLLHGFSDGYAKIDTNKFVDASGKIKEYKPNGKKIYNVSQFENGRALVSYRSFGKEKYYFIDKDFNRISRNTYDIAVSFNEERAIVGKKKKRFIIDTNENIIFEYDLKKDNIKTVSSYSEGLLCFSKNALWGYLDKEGHVAIEPQLEDDARFSNGVIVYYDKYQNLCTMDRKGDKKILLFKKANHKYGSISSFKKDFAIISRKGFIAIRDIIDKEGNIIEVNDNVVLYDDYLVLSGRQNFIPLEYLKNLVKDYKIIITRNGEEIIKTFESEEKRDKYFQMLQEEKNKAINESRTLYNSKIDQLLENPDKKYNEVYSIKGRPRTRKQN